MPTYSYCCENCESEFELFFYIKDYVEKPKCSCCNSKKTHRQYTKDIITQNTSVKKSDSELKTIGDLANRNRDRMSDDQKADLYQKHNSYKETKEEKPLPKGMSRMKKGKKTIWPS
ncbi:MAG: zinc ribbon domain-containing protein [Chitinophagia bacterium]|nr:zinc ribbon domain-containing protein [Chitinophagia bacterium]